MATQRLDWAGYLFGVEDGQGKVTEYPNYDLAVDGYQFRKSQGQKAALRMRAIYTTSWMVANSPDASDD